MPFHYKLFTLKILVLANTSHFALPFFLLKSWRFLDFDGLNNNQQMRKGTGANKRIHTEPTGDQRYQINIRAHGIIWVQRSKRKEKRSDLIQVKANKKIQYHCFKKYKTFPFTFDHLYDEETAPEIYSDIFSPANASNSIMSKSDYMLYCCGHFLKEGEELDQVLSIWYRQLEYIFSEWVKPQLYSMKIQALALTEQMVFDLISGKQIQIREVPSNKLLGTSDICFVGAEYQQIETPYQIYSLLQRAVQKKNQLFENSYGVIYCEVIGKDPQHQRRKIVFLDTTKYLKAENKNWDSNSLLVLNKCLLGLYNKMDNKDSYCPFRDSKLTRIMKSFLTFNSKVDILGFVNRDDDEHTLPTLNLVKNISRIRVPAQIQLDNPEQEKFVSPAKENQSTKMRMKSMESTESLWQLPKINLSQQIHENAGLEKKTILQLQKVRKQAKLIRTKNWLQKLKLGLAQESSLLKNLEQEELDYEQKMQKALILDLQKIREQRVETLSKSISKVQKLKLMKEYFNMAISGQKEQLQGFIDQQNAVRHVYEENIKIIEKNLKKNPRQLLNGSKQTPSLGNSHFKEDPHKKRNSSHQVGERNRLPGIGSAGNSSRRMTLVKARASKGRVEYQDFLTKNVEQYKSYLSPGKTKK